MNSSRPDLKLDWCDRKAADFAVRRWHYSRSLPTPPYNIVGVWEDGAFIGVVIFSRGASDALGSPYGLSTTEVCELTRIALSQHSAPVSRIVKIAVRFLAKRSPGMRLVVSYADPNEGHHGGVYQAGNWIYSGATSPDAKYIDRRGREWHSRQVSAKGFKKQYGQMRPAPKASECKKVPLLGKHRYLMPLDKAMGDQIAPLAKPYPKRAKQAMGGVQPSQQRGSTDLHAPSAEQAA